MMLSCKAASRLVSQSLDRPLTWQEKLALRFHLAICKQCKRFNQQMHQLGRVAKALVAAIEGNESLKLSSEAKARITNKFNQL